MPQERREGVSQQPRGRPLYVRVRPLTEWTSVGQFGRFGHLWTDGANSRGEAARQMPSRSNENLRICQPSRRERPLLRISLATALSTRIKHRAINHLR